MLKRQILSGRLCNGEMVQRLANGPKNSGASIDDGDIRVAHGHNGIHDTFCNKSVT